MSDLYQLQQKVKSVLEIHSFNVVKEVLTEDKFIFVANFGENLKNATFYIDKRVVSNKISIGAHITLGINIINDSLLNRIQKTTIKYDVSCSPVKYDEINNTGTLSLKTIYDAEEYNENNFIKHIVNFEKCVSAVYNDIQYYMQDFFYIDFSMFDAEKMNILKIDPYVYCDRRDGRFNGSWERYISSLQNDESKINELNCIKMFMEFESINNMPVEIVWNNLYDALTTFNPDVKQHN
jgi:hypothetical protein